MRCEFHMCQNFTLSGISGLRLKLHSCCADLAHVSTSWANSQVVWNQQFNPFGDRAANNSAAVKIANSQPTANRANFALDNSARSCENGFVSQSAPNRVSPTTVRSRSLDVGYSQFTPHTTATAQSPKTQPLTPDVGLADLPVAVLRGVMWVDRHGVIDFAEDGEHRGDKPCPDGCTGCFTLSDGHILAIRDTDGSIHRTGVGRSKKYDAVLAAIGEN